MFGKKEERVIIPLKGYGKEVLDRVESVLCGKPVFRDIDWRRVDTLAVDRVTLRVRDGRLPVECHLEYMPFGRGDAYLLGWRRGIGKFIERDWRRFLAGKGDELLTKQRLVDLGCKSWALVRKVSPSDYSDGFIEASEMEYGSVSFKVGGQYWLVEKVFGQDGEDIERDAFPRKTYVTDPQPTTFEDLSTLVQPIEKEEPSPESMVQRQQISEDLSRRPKYSTPKDSSYPNEECLF